MKSQIQKMKKGNQTLGLVFITKNNIRCDKCEILLEQRLWQNKIIAYSTNSHVRYGYICVKCMLKCKLGFTAHRTEKQLNDFVRCLRK